MPITLDKIPEAQERIFQLQNEVQKLDYLLSSLLDSIFYQAKNQFLSDSSAKLVSISLTEEQEKFLLNDYEEQKKMIVDATNNLL